MKFTYIHGVIQIDRDYSNSVKFLKNIGRDKSYPFVNSNMFSFGDYEIPYYYENMVLSFAASYKYFGIELEDWYSFIEKIENILRNVDFLNAQFHCDSEIGSYTLFWTKSGSSHLGKENEEKYLREYKLTKTGEWFFGFGKRSILSGYPDDIEAIEDLRDYPDFGFKYPIEK